MSDKSPRQSNDEKVRKSLKEQRAAKAAQAQASATDSLINGKKR